MSSRSRPGGLAAPIVILAYFRELCYNFIMDSKNGGLSSDDLKRQAAAEIARKKVLAAYAGAKNLPTALMPSRTVTI